MRSIYLIVTFCLLTIPLFSQSNTLFTNPLIDQVLRGNYNPADYAATTPITDPVAITQMIALDVSEDSLREYLVEMSAFGTRNTGSDTVSNTFGIGAARRWAHEEFSKISAANEDRLLVGYLQFDELICSVPQHRNIVGVLPGTAPSGEGYVLIEGHLDSRCDVTCDPLCEAQGAEDNGSGSALVLELARVMSQFSMEETVVFMLTIGEEQGLWGAKALADYCDDENIPVKAVLNNDVVGGIYCGATSSPPSCPGAGAIDSTNVRLFSHGNYNSPFKQFARYTKLQYKEMLSQLVDVPTSIHIMTGEDRTGRGGDHIPFRQLGFTAIRMTSANEHGNGSAGPSYTDRQHTSADSLGVDTDNDGLIDSFYVDFNYLARNARINGVSGAMAAIGPDPVTSFNATAIPGGVAIEVLGNPTVTDFRFATRTNSNDWDSVFTINAAIDTIWGLQGQYIISMAAVDLNGVESLFSYETNINVPTSTGELLPEENLELFGNKPNPFDEQTTIIVKRNGHIDFDEAYILIQDIEGREVERIPLTLEADINEVNFLHGFHATGTYIYSLVVDGEVLGRKKMIMQ